MLTSAFSAIPFTANAAEVNVPKVSQSRDAEHYVITSGDYRYENIDGKSIIFWEYLGSDTDVVIPVLGKISYLIIFFLNLHLPFVGSAQNSTF